MKTWLSAVPTLACLAILPAPAFAVLETEPNDTKAQANLIALPAVSTLAAITGNSTSATLPGLDYFRVVTAPQGTPGFYRHRLICTSPTPGHTISIRGLTQTNGVVDQNSDFQFQTGSTATTPPRFVQFYTSQAGGEIYVRVSGTAATTADYDLDYEVTLVTEIVGPTILHPSGTVVISTVGQTTVDTETWAYDPSRAPIPLFGNDNEPAPGTSLQSRLTRNYATGTYHLGVSNFELAAGNLSSPPDDRFLNGPVLDFASASANSQTNINQVLNPSIGGIVFTVSKTEPFQIVFISFGVTLPVDLVDFRVE